MSHRVHFSVAVVVAAVVLQPVQAADLRGYVHIVGSHSIRPFADAVADKLAKSKKVKRPWVESTGSRGGIKLFCEGTGADAPDIVNASRRMEQREFDFCRSTGVKDIVEVKIGYGAVTLARLKKQAPLRLTRKALYLALAKEIPDPACAGCETFVRNPFRTWKEVDPALPDVEIEVLGPPEGSGTREVFSDLVMEGACVGFPAASALKDRDAARFDTLCRTIREDGAYVRENPDKLADKLSARPGAIAIMAYNQFFTHSKTLDAVSIEGVAPSADSVMSQQYPVSRTLYFYVKGDRVGKVPGLAQYIAEFTHNRAWGDKGYLVAKGLIPMPAAERKAVAGAAKALKRVSL